MSTDIIDKLLVGFSLFLSGALITHLWNRFRSRVVKLRWSAEYTPMAFAEDSPTTGRVEVRYNDTPVRNLYIGVIRIQNPSAVDLKDLKVDFQVSEGSLILLSLGRILGSLNEFEFAEPFAARVKAIADGSMLSEPEQVHFYTNRRYSVPVLNRGTLAHFGFLLTRPDGLQPTLMVSCDHVGTKLVARAPEQEFWGVRLRVAQVTGIVASLLLLGFTLSINLQVAGWSYFGWFLGLLTVLIGAFLTNLWRSFVRLLS